MPTMGDERLFPTESHMMRVLESIGMESLAWSLRRLHCPVSADALTLEVGSGGNPYPRANVLLDAYEDTRERHWVPLVTDRPFVFGYIENLPFKSGAFDFLIASHVLEHSLAPERTLAEFQRVARAGYIEVPDAFLERVNPYKDHRLEITLRNATLQIRKKAGWIVDQELVELYEDRVKPLLTRELIPHHPFDFHVRYYWKGEIKYRIHNSEIDVAWPPPTDDNTKINRSNPKNPLRSQFISQARRLFSQRSRNRQISVIPLLRCPTCLSEEDLLQRSDKLLCKCKTEYTIKNGVPVMYPQ